VTDTTRENQPAAVGQTPIQAGDTQGADRIRAQWAWVEPSIGTARMVTALEQGVKGGKWFSLMDKVYRLCTLGEAFEQGKATHGAAGVDHQTVDHCEHNLRQNLTPLSDQLRNGT